MRPVTALLALPTAKSLVTTVPLDLPAFVKNLGTLRKQKRQEIAGLNTELQLRPALAVGCLCFVLIGCPVGIWLSRSDFLSAFITCFLPIVFLYYPVLLCGTNFAKGGRIVVLSELEAPPGEGLKILMQHDDPTEALRPLRRAAPPDLIPATELAEAVDWADVYLLSKLDSDLVEDLFMTPLESEDEVKRLLGLEEQVLFVSSAQHTFGRIRAR